MIHGSRQVNWSDPQNLNKSTWDITAKGVYVIFYRVNQDYNNKAVYIGTNRDGVLGNRIDDHKYDNRIQQHGGNSLQVTYIVVDNQGERFGIESYLHAKLKPIIRTEVTDYHIEVNLPPHF